MLRSLLFFIILAFTAVVNFSMSIYCRWRRFTGLVYLGMPLFVWLQCVEQWHRNTGEEKMVRSSVVYCSVKVHSVALRGEFSVGLWASVKELWEWWGTHETFSMHGVICVYFFCASHVCTFLISVFTILYIFFNRKAGLPFLSKKKYILLLL